MNTLFKDLYPDDTDTYSGEHVEPVKTAADRLEDSVIDNKSNGQDPDVQVADETSDGQDPQLRGAVDSIVDNKQREPQQAKPQQAKQQNQQSNLDKLAQKYYELSGGKIAPVKDEDREKQLKRQQSVANLTDAFLTLGKAFYGTKGYNIPAPQPNPVYQRARAELQRLEDAYSKEKDNARRTNLMNRIRAVQLAQNQINTKNRQDAISANAERNYELEKQRADAYSANSDANTKYRDAQAETAKEYKKAMAAAAKQNADTHSYNATHKKGAKPYLTVDLGGGQFKHLTKKQVYDTANKFIQSVKDDNFYIPEFIQKIHLKGAPLSDSEAKEIVRWMFYPKPGGSGRPEEDVTYPYEKNTDAFGNSIVNRTSLLPK